MLSQSTQREIARTVEAFVQATGNDDGYKSAQTIVAGAASDRRLARVWRLWRRLAFAHSPDQPTTDSDPAQVQVRLLFRSVEIEDLSTGREAGEASQAQIKVHLDVATVTPALPVLQWPIDPWQGDFTLQKADAPNALWQFVIPHPAAMPAPFLQFPQRGGDHLAQAIEVLRRPDALLRTARAQQQQNSLRLLFDAVRLYVAKTGHYPPSRYFAALLSTAPQSSRSALRQAFHVAGEPRVWKLNPALAGRDALPQQMSPQTPLFWDGTTTRFYGSMAGFTVVAFVDGRVELTSAQDLQLPQSARASHP